MKSSSPWMPSTIHAKRNFSPFACKTVVYPCVRNCAFTSHRPHLVRACKRIGAAHCLRQIVCANKIVAKQQLFIIVSRSRLSRLLLPLSSLLHSHLTRIRCSDKKSANREAINVSSAAECTHRFNRYRTRFSRMKKKKKKKPERSIGMWARRRRRWQQQQQQQ